ncbi:unnamed protein product, partial [Gulo gulo]
GYGVTVLGVSSGGGVTALGVKSSGDTVRGVRVRSGCGNSGRVLHFRVCRGDEQSVPQVGFGAEAPGKSGLAMDFLPLEGSKVNKSGVKSRL